MQYKRFGAIGLTMTLLCSTASGLTGCTLGNTQGMRKIATTELVQEMGMGINLGNTFEACGDWINSSSVQNYETAWGSPVLTQPMVQGYADAGFGVLRVPVAWSNMMQADYTIHPDYLVRVKEVVGWALDADLYVILNIHWDGGWWKDFPTDKDACMTKYTRIWEQICSAFSSFDDHLVFESLNEEGCWDSLWNRYSGKATGKADAYGLLNEINQKFVDIVRSAKGNNPKRHLLIAGYATDVALTCDPMFKMPSDPQTRCAVSMHYYTPSTFCILAEDADWGKAKKEWGSPADYAELTKNMDLIKTTFIDKGIPVILGEFGVERSNKTPEMVNRYLSAVVKEASNRSICPVLWDVTNGFYNRSTAQVTDESQMATYLNLMQSE